MISYVSADYYYLVQEGRAAHKLDYLRATRLHEINENLTLNIWKLQYTKNYSVISWEVTGILTAYKSILGKNWMHSESTRCTYTAIGGDNLSR